MSVSIRKSMRPTLAFCMTSPFSRVVISKVYGSMISSEVTNRGPNAPLPAIAHKIATQSH